MDDDGGALADHVIACLQDHGLWRQLSQGGFALAQRLSVAAQVASIESVSPALQNHLSGGQPIRLIIELGDLVFEMLFDLAAYEQMGGCR